MLRAHRAQNPSVSISDGSSQSPADGSSGGLDEAGEGCDRGGGQLGRGRRLLDARRCGAVPSRRVSGRPRRAARPSAADRQPSRRLRHPADRSCAPPRETAADLSNSCLSWPAGLALPRESRPPWTRTGVGRSYGGAGGVCGTPPSTLRAADVALPWSLGELLSGRRRRTGVSVAARVLPLLWLADVGRHEVAPAPPRDAPSGSQMESTESQIVEHGVANREARGSTHDTQPAQRPPQGPAQNRTSPEATRAEPASGGDLLRSVGGRSGSAMHSATQSLRPASAATDSSPGTA